MADRTDVDTNGVQRTREFKEQWRSTPEGEVDYRATVDRVLAKVDRMRDDFGIVD